VKEPYSGDAAIISSLLTSPRAILERSNVSSFPLGGKAPEQFFHALGRVSFETERVSAHLDLLLQVLTQIEDVNSDCFSWR
jgi:hypothetical protein